MANLIACPEDESEHKSQLMVQCCKLLQILIEIYNLNFIEFELFLKFNIQNKKKKIKYMAYLVNLGYVDDTLGPAGVPQGTQSLGVVTVGRRNSWQGRRGKATATSQVWALNLSLL